MKRAIPALAAALSLAFASAAYARGIDVDKVNGSIHIENGQQAGELSTVNGSIRVDSGASAEKVSTVNGGIETVSGDVEIGANSRVEGGLLVERPHGFSWGKSKNPRIVIGPHAVVDGTLEFRREVDLYVSDSAKVGTITGATANKFSGDRP